MTGGAVRVQRYISYGTVQRYNALYSRRRRIPHRHLRYYFRLRAQELTFAAVLVGPAVY